MHFLTTSSPCFLLVSPFGFLGPSHSQRFLFLDVRFCRIGHVGYRNMHLLVRFTRNGQARQQNACLNVRFSRIGHLCTERKARTVTADALWAKYQRSVTDGSYNVRGIHAEVAIMAVIRPAFTKQLPPENCDVQSKIIKEIREKNYYYE